MIIARPVWECEGSKKRCVTLTREREISIGKEAKGKGKEAKTKERELK